MAPNSYTPQVMIDTHHHFVFEEYRKAVEDAGGDPSGWPVPAWTPAATDASLERNGAATAILSLTSPGAPIAGSDAGARDLARKANEYCATLRDSNPQRYGFFAAMPNALDTEGTLAEIAYALDRLSADGVTLFTRYGDGNYYLGHRALAPIWAELNRRRAVVFIHPTHPVDTNKVNPKLLQPSVDYPHETTRTVLDILMSNTRRDNPDCRIVLPHAGGTLPWIFPRTTTLLRGIPREQTPLGKTYEEMWAEFRSFYFDLALSSSHAGLDLLLKIVPNDCILYGSDYPYPPPTSVSNFRADLESFSMSEETRNKIYFKNALTLLPRLRQARAKA